MMLKGVVENIYFHVTLSTSLHVEMFSSSIMEHPFLDAVKSSCELEDQLHERDVELTESRLQSLASSHRIEQLQERVSDLEVVKRSLSVCSSN